MVWENVGEFCTFAAIISACNGSHDALSQHLLSFSFCFIAFLFLGMGRHVYNQISESVVTLSALLFRRTVCVLYDAYQPIWRANTP